MKLANHLIKLSPSFLDIAQLDPTIYCISGYYIIILLASYCLLTYYTLVNGGIPEVRTFIKIASATIGNHELLTAHVAVRISNEERRQIINLSFSPSGIVKSHVITDQAY